MPMISESVAKFSRYILGVNFKDFLSFKLALSATGSIFSE